MHNVHGSFMNIRITCNSHFYQNSFVEYYNGLRKSLLENDLSFFQCSGNVRTNCHGLTIPGHLYMDEGFGKKDDKETISDDEYCPKSKSFSQKTICFQKNSNPFMYDNMSPKDYNGINTDLILIAGTSLEIDSFVKLILMTLEKNSGVNVILINPCLPSKHVKQKFKNYQDRIIYCLTTADDFVTLLLGFNSHGKFVRLIIIILK